MRGALIGMLATMATSAVAQQPPPAATIQASPSDDIVVDGLRDIDDPASPVTRATLGSGKTGPGAIASRQAFELAQRYARCAIKPGVKAAAELRGALDDTINSARQTFQQTRFVQLTSTCAQDPDIARQLGIASSGNDLPIRYYDRGAMYLQAIRVFAPGLSLTKRETADTAVQARFNARENRLERFRLTADRVFFETAVCLVRLQPELSVRLVMSDDYASFGPIEAEIVNRARICTGNAKKVYFDPMQFRFYIADALYRWTAAAKGVDSLIPPPSRN